MVSLQVYQDYRDSPRVPLCLSNFTKLTAHCVAWPTVPYPGLFYLYCTNMKISTSHHSASYAIALRILLLMYRDSIHSTELCGSAFSHTHSCGYMLYECLNSQHDGWQSGCIEFLISTLQQ